MGAISSAACTYVRLPFTHTATDEEADGTTQQQRLPPPPFLPDVAYLSILHP